MIMMMMMIIILVVVGIVSVETHFSIELCMFVIILLETPSFAIVGRLRCRNGIDKYSDHRISHCGNDPPKIHPLWVM